jgi:hypothetical protein
MSFVNVTPQAVEAAATDLSAIGSTFEEATSFASASTTSIMPAAADEVSAAISALFNTHGAEFQALAQQAQQFHREFVQTLSQSSAAYQATDLNAAGPLRQAVTSLENQLGFGNIFPGSSAPTAPIPPSVTNPYIVVGGTGYATVPPRLLNQIGAYYGATGPVYGIYTPEQFWPLTPALGSLTLNQSINAGQKNLDAVIQSQLAAGHSPTIWGTSQGATVETQEIKYLMAHGSPGTDQLKFVLTGDPNNPDGGAFTRFPNLRIPGWGVHFSGATPPNSPYQTSIYTNQYDAVGNFPRYPLNVVSDANALAGFAFGAHDYVDDPYQTIGAHQLPTSPGYTGRTSYYETLTQNLPLLDPIRFDVQQPYGAAIADLLQPDMRVLVDMGYGSGEYANLPTPASLIEFPNIPNIAHDLALGTMQGPQQALLDLGLPGGHSAFGEYPYSPVVDPQLNYPQPQYPVTGLSLLTMSEGFLAPHPR